MAHVQMPSVRIANVRGLFFYHELKQIYAIAF
jgi:hypothetical protein